MNTYAYGHPTAARVVARSRWIPRCLCWLVMTAETAFPLAVVASRAALVTFLIVLLALHLVNGDTVEGKLNRSTVISNLIAAKKSPGDILDELFVRAVSRKPSEAEKKKLLPLVAANDKKAYDDVFWALLNSTEFEFNH